jgi:hypothetical protein
MMALGSRGQGLRVTEEGPQGEEETELLLKMTVLSVHQLGQKRETRKLVT